MISLTAAAVSAIKERRQGSQALRIGLKGGGCSGFSYVLAYVDDPPNPQDHVLSFDDVSVFVDPKSMKYLSGMTLDWEKSLIWSGFKFINPNEKSRCGCGSSFSV